MRWTVKVISSSNLLLRNGDQSLDWDIIVRDVQVPSVKTELINDRDFHDYFEKSLTTGSDFTLVQPTFDTLLHADKLTVSGSINLVDIIDFYNRSMKTEGDQIITGQHLYSNLKVDQLTVDGVVNGQKFPDDRFISISANESAANLSTLRLMQSASFSSLNVTDDFAGLQVNAEPLDADMLLKSSSDTQVITGQKVFEAVRSMANVTSHTVNSQPVPMFETESSIHGSQESLVSYDGLDIGGTGVFKHPLVVGDLLDVDLNRLKNHAVLLDASEIPAYNSISFTDDVIITGDLNAEIVNGIYSHQFVPRNTTEPITIDGRKEFNNGLNAFKMFNLSSAINGYNLQDVWNDTLQLEGNQIITDPLVVNNDVSAVSITAHNTQFVPLKDVGKLSGMKQFHQLQIGGDWTADSIETTGLVDGIDIRSWPNDTLMKNGKNQTVMGRKSFTNVTLSDVHVPEMDNFDTSVFTNIVTNNEPQVVGGDLEILGSFQVTTAVVEGLFDGDDCDLPLHWLRYGAEQFLSDGISAQASLTADSYYDRSWMINQINIRDLLDQTVKINESVKLESQHFDHVIVDNINVGGTIQECIVPDDFILKSSETPQIITGYKTFAGTVQSDSLTVDTINGQDPQVLCDSVPIPQSSKWIIQGNVLLKAGAKFNVDTVNQHKLDEMMHHVWLKDEDVHLQHGQSFGDVIVDELLENDGVVNGVDLHDMARRSIDISSISNQDVKAIHRFDTLAATRLNIDQFEGVFINDMSMAGLKDSVLLRATEQDIRNDISFQDVAVENVVVSGLVNGIDINDELMLKSRPNVVKGDKVFNRILVDGDVEMCGNCTIDGVDVSHWAQNAVSRHGNFSLAERVEFDEITLAKPLALDGKLNGITVDRNHLMTLSGDQVIDGRLTFSSKEPESILKDLNLRAAYLNSTEQSQLSARIGNFSVRGLYDGVNLTRFYDKAVRLSVETTFTAPVSLSGLSAEKTVDASSNSTIRDILMNVSADEYHIADPEVVEKVPQSELDALLETITQVASKQAVELQYFKEVDLTTSASTGVYNVYPLNLVNEQLVFCNFNKGLGQLFCGSSTSPLLDSVRVTSVAVHNDDRSSFAVSAEFLSPTTNATAGSFIYSIQNPATPMEEFIEIQNIPLISPISSAALTINDQSCFVFANVSSIDIYCRSNFSDVEYSLAQSLSTSDVRQIAVCNKRDESPMLAVRSESRQGVNRVVVWNINEETNRFEALKTIVTSRIVSMDCGCDSHQCYIATLSPSKPAAIPGDVMIWSLSGSGQPIRLQRISVSEPNDVKFALLPDGRLSLYILQRSGIHNILVYIWQGQALFNYKTTVHVPGVEELKLVSGQSLNRIIMVLTVKSPISGLVPQHSIRTFEAQFLGLLN